jgi:hypothetical protein
MRARGLVFLPPEIQAILGVMRRILLAAAALLATLYLCDYLSLKLKVGGREPFGSVLVQRYYAVTMKDKKTEFMFDPPQSQTCVNSLFPHFGDTPCWYVANHKKQRIDIGAGSNPIF